MRLLLRLRATADAEYKTDYHHKLRGWIWKALRGSVFDEAHGSDTPLGLAFSNIFPPGRIEEDDQRTLLVASPHEELLTQVAGYVQRNPGLDIGWMSFEAEDISVVEPDVGEPGTRGTIETGTGILARISPEHRERHGISTPATDEVTFWRPEHTMEPFHDVIEANLQLKHDLFAPTYLQGPTDVDHSLFQGYDLIKTYALPLTVTQGEERTVILSKWRFEYEVRDDHHRRHLNLALDCGLGGRNALGLGFVNITDQRTARGETPQPFAQRGG